MKAIQKIKSNLLNTINVLRQRPFLSLYLYITSRRIFTLWRSRTYIQNLRNIRIAGLSSSFLFGLLALAIIIPLYNVTGTEDTEAATSYNEASITLNSSDTAAAITADAATIGSAGTAFISSDLSISSQYASYSISTTNATGYTIGIAANSSGTSTSLTSGSNTLSSLPYNSTTMNGLSSATYNTSAYDNTWALYPGTVGGSANSKYYPISDDSITMDTTSAANSTNNTYKVGIAARITMNQASGTYMTTAGNFKITAVGNPAAYSITYDANGGSGAPGATGSMSTTNQSIALSSSIPTRDGYNFFGWCTALLSDQANGTSGSAACASAGGTYYAVGGTFYIDETTKNTTILYAMWEQAIVDLGTMQNLDASKCTTKLGKVTDSRDGEEYFVQQLADGNCWMLDNLRLGSTSYMTLTSSDTNINVSSWTLPAGITVDFFSYNAAQINIASKNTVASVKYGNGSGKIGVYYNYCAASAGNICANEDSNSSNGSPNRDICPKGWRMPTGGLSGEYKALYTAYSNDATDFRNALSTPLSGYFISVSPTYQGSYGYFWSSTLYSGSGMYEMYVDSSNAYPTGDINRRYGRSVRCILKPQSMITFNFDSDVTGVDIKDSAGNTIDTITTSGTERGLLPSTTYTISPTFADGYVQDSMTLSGSGTLSGDSFTVGTSASTISITSKQPTYMQSMSFNDCATVAQTVYDSRDGEPYLVQKLADGNCWMLDNLRLGSTSTITLRPSDTNIPSSLTSWTLPASITSGFTSYTAAQINVASKNTTTTGYGSGSKKIGVYYNYCAASAGNICSSSNSSNGSPDRDICPKGWRMPTGGSSGEYQALYTAYSSNATNFRNALSTPLSGDFINSSAEYQGSRGDFWSSTRYDGYSMYELHVDSSNVYPADRNGRRIGYSVRCILKPPVMQDMNQATLTALAPNIGDTVSLIDNRDGEKYLIGKLADGNYWMLDNLRLGSTSSMTLTSTNTNINISSWTLPAGITSDFISYTAPQINVTSKDTVASTKYGNGSGKIGVYYNYCAASAGNICAAIGSNKDNGSADRDICPKGWRMPTGGSSGEYQALYTAYSSNNTNFRNALSTPLSGYFRSSSASYQGTSGLFWSSTQYGGDIMYGLYVYSSGVNLANHGTMNDGFPVRCILKTPTMLQSITQSELASRAPNTGDIVSLIDKRDNEPYLIGKLADGNYWMLDNLRLGSDSAITLTSSDTNITSTVGSWTLPKSGTVCFSSSSCTGTNGTTGTGYTVPAINTDSKNTVPSTTYGNGSGKVGVYYNYCAASAGGICKSSNSSNGSPDRDICPKGWRMPTGNTSGEYQALYTAYSSDATNFRNALSTPLSGYFEGSSANGQGSNGRFWSSTRYDGNYMYVLLFSSSNVLPASSRSRYDGLSVRCILK